MRVKGNSGCRVELMGESIVQKSAHGGEAERLKRQIKKQIEFAAQEPAPNIFTPRVVEEIALPGGVMFKMDYVTAKDFVEFLTESNRSELDYFLKTICFYVSRNLENSKMEDAAEPLRRKIDELAGRGVPAHYVETARARSHGPIVVPAGPCHGDLTLSNILFKDDKLCLIDFLDTFVESPLQDIVKLRQDTAFGWSLHLYSEPFDQTKIRIALNYLDRSLNTAFAAHDWYARHYRLFQYLNFMRILPYCKSAADAGIVSGILDQMA